MYLIFVLIRRKPDAESVSLVSRQSYEASPEQDPDKTPRAVSELHMNPGMFLK